MSSLGQSDDDTLCVCCVCTCEIEPTESYIACAANTHRVHDGECWQQYLLSLNQSASTHARSCWLQREAIPCMITRCPSYISEDAALHSTEAALYVKTSRQIACAAEREKTAQAVRAEMLKESNEAMKSAAEHIRKEIRSILTDCICCPYCSAVFYDFDGCLALTCHRCEREFCGVCLRSHGKDMRDGHAMVESHQRSFTPAEISTYSLNLPYFMNTSKWPQWREKLQLQAVVAYLKTLRKEVVWDAWDDTLRLLREEKLFSESSINFLHAAVFAHDVGAFHLIRLPVTFWLIYSAKKNCRFEDAVELTQEQRLSMGKHVVDKIRKRYPSWQPVRQRVPGETFEAISYPPELLTSVATGIDEWGKREGLW